MKKILKFQKENNLRVDGIIGKNTARMMMKVWKIATVERLAHFLGQTDHETIGFTADTENMNYRVENILKTFPKYFTSMAHAMEYAHKPKKLADFVYGNRMGNNSCNGYFFRGRGAVHTTGLDNYTALANFVNDNCIIKHPELVADQYFWESALFYFDDRKIWQLCDSVGAKDIKAVTYKVNGGYNGLSSRVKKTTNYYKSLSKSLY